MSEANETKDRLEDARDKEEAPSDAEKTSPEETSDAPEEVAEGTNPMQALIEEQEARMQTLIEEQQEARKNEGGWLRARADFANYKKRAEREKRNSFQRGSLDALKNLLPVIDGFDRVFEDVPEEIRENPWLEGVRLIQREFEKLLEKYQIEAIDPTGEPFDPNFHEAIGTDDSDDVESGYVTATLRKGYRAGDMVLRSALVRVAS